VTVAGVGGTAVFINGAVGGLMSPLHAAMWEEARIAALETFPAGLARRIAELARPRPRRSGAPSGEPLRDGLGLRRGGHDPHQRR